MSTMLRIHAPVTQARAFVTQWTDSQGYFADCAREAGATVSEGAWRTFAEFPDGSEAMMSAGFSQPFVISCGKDAGDGTRCELDRWHAGECSPANVPRLRA